MTVAYNSDVTAITSNTGYPEGYSVGVSATDKLGFYGATPVVRAAATVGAITALVAMGLLASGTAFGDIVLNDGDDLAFGTTVGTKIGTATAQKLAFYGLTPVIQQAASAQAAVTTATITAVATTGSVTTGFGYSTTAQADGIQASLNQVVTRVTSLTILVNQIRADLVTLGLEKGSA